MINTKLIKELESYILINQTSSPLSSSSLNKRSSLDRLQHKASRKKASTYSDYQVNESSKIYPDEEVKSLDHNLLDKKTTNMEESLSPPKDIKNYILHNKTPKFNEILFNFIDSKNLQDSIVYKKAHIDRRLFSKIRTNQDYKPKKTTVLALGLALELTLEELTILLKSAGYALGKSHNLDLIIHFCLEKKIYNIIEVNLLLDYFSIKEL